MQQLLFVISVALSIITHQAIALEAKKTTEPMVIDGKVSESSWQQAPWYPLDQIILGDKPTSEDFSGRFKMLWDEQQLYLLAEISDDILFDQHANPLHFYWDDDCLEIFIDEDASGGDHQFNFNAFAYHIALDNQVVDIGEPTPTQNDNFILLNDHIDSVWQRSEQSPHKIYWEVAIRVYDDSYQHNSATKTLPVKLHLGKKLGFMLAYCDNDGSRERENFIGSTFIKAVNGNKNLGFITADVFDTLVLTQ